MKNYLCLKTNTWNGHFCLFLEIWQIVRGTEVDAAVKSLLATSEIFKKKTVTLKKEELNQFDGQIRNLQRPRSVIPEAFRKYSWF